MKSRFLRYISTYAKEIHIFQSDIRTHNHWLWIWKQRCAFYWGCTWESGSMLKCILHISLFCAASFPFILCIGACDSFHAKSKISLITAFSYFWYNSSQTWTNTQNRIDFNMNVFFQKEDNGSLASRECDYYISRALLIQAFCDYIRILLNFMRCLFERKTQHFQSNFKLDQHCGHLSILFSRNDTKRKFTLKKSSSKAFGTCSWSTMLLLNAFVEKWLWNIVVDKLQVNRTKIVLRIRLNRVTFLSNEALTTIIAAKNQC